MGAVTPIGVGVEAFVGGLRRGESGTRVLPRDMPGRERIRSTAAACCWGFDPRGVMGEADLRRLPRLVPMALGAAREALGRANLLSGGPLAAEGEQGSASLEQAGPAQRVGLVLGTGAGGIDFTLDQAKTAYAGEGDRQPSLWTITNATHGNLAGELSIRLGLRGPSLCVSTGCASSSDAIGLAMDVLRSGRPGAPEAMLVVGADAHVRWETLQGMELLKVISTRRHDERSAPTASRPFDKDRDGFILGEGAWALVLETEAFARWRGAGVIGRLLGYAATCDAFHRVRPDPDMTESARAMRLAVQDAGAGMDQIELLHYHGTATRMNDALETRAVRLAFGAHAEKLCGHSVKSQIGHPQGACGAAAVVATLGALTASDGAFSPATINLDEPDEADGCDLDYTPNKVARARGDELVMVNCLAFGAKNSALVVRAGS